MWHTTDNCHNSLVKFNPLLRILFDLVHLALPPVSLLLTLRSLRVDYFSYALVDQLQRNINGRQSLFAPQHPPGWLTVYPRLELSLRSTTATIHLKKNPVLRVFLALSCYVVQFTSTLYTGGVTSHVDCTIKTKPSTRTKKLHRTRAVGQVVNVTVYVDKSEGPRSTWGCGTRTC
jgi:hypothetical protein